MSWANLQGLLLIGYPCAVGGKAHEDSSGLSSFWTDSVCEHLGDTVAIQDVLKIAATSIRRKSGQTPQYLLTPDRCENFHLARCDPATRMEGVLVVYQQMKA